MTGSAHTLLAPYWLGGLSAHPDVARGGGDVVRCRQVSERGGEVEVEWAREKQRCLIRGSATLMSQGTFFV